MLLTAAYHVLRRLPVPRHPPCALFSLTFMLESSRVVRNCMFTELLQLPIIIFHILYHFTDIACSRSVLFSIQFSKYKIYLKQLSLFYSNLVGLSGLEPPTSRLSGVRSNQLSYKPIFQEVASGLPYFHLVEMRRIELLTPCLQGRCSPS